MFCGTTLEDIHSAESGDVRLDSKETVDALNMWKDTFIRHGSRVMIEWDTCEKTWYIVGSEID